MNLHEYQAKEMFRGYGIPVPAGEVAASAEAAVAAARALGGERLGGQGPGARRRPRQGGRREARARPRGGTRGGGGHARHAPGHEADRRRRACRSSRSTSSPAPTSRASCICRLTLESRARPHRLHRLRGRRHGHRGSRGDDAGEDPVASTSIRRRACRRYQARELAFGLASTGAQIGQFQAHRRGALPAVLSSGTRAWSRSIR